MKIKRYYNVRFENKGKPIACISLLENEFKVNEQIVADIQKGCLDSGIILADITDKFESNNQIPKIIRLMSKEDLEKKEKNTKDENNALEKCNDKIFHHKLNMFLLDCHYTLDKRKITFYFAAEKRVDFRNLVKDLANIFKTRIELIQVGVRDAAKKIGGLGICGRPICCSYFLYNFPNITVKEAKLQNLPLNPTKISGCCGKLMCCLGFEEEHYCKEIKKYPQRNISFTIDNNKYTVINFNIIMQTVTYFIENVGVKSLQLDEFMNKFNKYIKNADYNCS